MFKINSYIEAALKKRPSTLDADESKVITIRQCKKIKFNQ